MAELVSQQSSSTIYRLACELGAYRLREALADASAATAVQATALTAAAGEAIPTLAQIRHKTQPRVRGAARLAAEKEIADFRKTLDGRLQAARGRVRDEGQTGAEI